ncbi:NAD(P)/FAD-dependent oxidoreductase [Acetatifactor aquisgranensis]|uniref:NAD(P)/FAD-dependent oxidoreductase n=1 Tax=Acetatifactor aquisgranensis TaxID=2941233 RepID=UPI002040BA84|nr:NAD(P)/FAD-dependent oxidoreductase [Acetatifactor aquisgranensis]
MTDLVIIGGGPAGMSAAVAAYESGIRDILILERDAQLGGILQQCIHNGFGLHRFGEELTGPEYAWKYEKQVRELGIPVKLNTMVLSVTPDRVITATNEEEGIFAIEARAIILAMGCRERPRGALNIAGTRPAGIYSAGTAQKLVNRKGYLPGKSVVILGSGDIGLIMARRMTLEGAEVKAVCELMPYSGGLARNIEQCLNDFGIPLKLSHTVVEIHGRKRLEGVTIAKVDENRRPIEETKEYIPCDTLLLSVGLIPENELTLQAGIGMDVVTGGAVVDQDRQTSREGIFTCGNVLHVHDLVDFVSEEAAVAGKSAAEYIRGESGQECDIPIGADGKIRYTVPQRITKRKDITLFFRVADIYRNVKINVVGDGRVIHSVRKPKAAPGEMESLLLKAPLFEGVSKLSLQLEELG